MHFVLPQTLDALLMNYAKVVISSKKYIILIISPALCHFGHIIDFNLSLMWPLACGTYTTTILCTGW